MNHALTSNGLPPLNRYSAQQYRDVLDVLKGISKDPRWREHRAATTDAFNLNICKKIFHASVTKPDGDDDLLAVRNKALAVTMSTSSLPTVAPPTFAHP